MSDSLQPLDYSSPGSSVHGIFQARILEWVTISSSGDLLDPGIKPASAVFPALQADSLITELSGNPMGSDFSCTQNSCVEILTPKVMG